MQNLTVPRTTSQCAPSGTIKEPCQPRPRCQNQGERRLGAGSTVLRIVRGCSDPLREQLVAQAAAGQPQAPKPSSDSRLSHDGAVSYRRSQDSGPELGSYRSGPEWMLRRRGMDETGAWTDETTDPGSPMSIHTYDLHFMPGEEPDCALLCP